MYNCPICLRYKMFYEITSMQFMICISNTRNAKLKILAFGYVKYIGLHSTTDNAGLHISLVIAVNEQIYVLSFGTYTSNVHLNNIRV